MILLLWYSDHTLYNKSHDKVLKFLAKKKKIPELLFWIGYYWQNIICCFNKSTVLYRYLWFKDAKQYKTMFCHFGAESGLVFTNGVFGAGWYMYLYYSLYLQRFHNISINNISLYILLMGEFYFWTFTSSIHGHLKLRKIFFQQRRTLGTFFVVQVHAIDVRMIMIEL